LPLQCEADEISARDETLNEALNLLVTQSSALDNPF
jgi:hypothetical protein